MFPLKIICDSSLAPLANIVSNTLTLNFVNQNLYEQLFDLYVNRTIGENIEESRGLIHISNETTIISWVY